MKKIPLIFEDVGGHVLPATIPRMVKRSMEVLDSYPDGKLMTTRLLALNLGVGINSLQCYSTDPRLAPYRANISNSVYWGNKSTIKQANEKE